MIQRQRHDIAGLRFLHIDLAGDLALVVGGDQPGAVLAPQPVLKGLLHAALAHQRVHGIALVPVFRPILRVNAGDAAQNVGGIGSVVIPDRGLPRGDTGKIAVGDLGDQLGGYVLGKHIALPAGQLIADTGNKPGLRAGIAVADAEQRPQVFQQRRRGGLDRQLVFRQKLGKGLVIPGGQVQIRRILGDGQSVHPGGIRLLAQGDQPPDGGVQLLVTLKILLVEGKGIGQAVGHQHLAVGIGEDTTAGLHRLPCGIGGDGSGPVFTAIEDLGIIQRGEEQQQH